MPSHASSEGALTISVGSSSGGRDVSVGVTEGVKVGSGVKVCVGSGVDVSSITSAGASVAAGSSTSAGASVAAGAAPPQDEIIKVRIRITMIRRITSTHFQIIIVGATRPVRARLLEQS